MMMLGMVTNTLMVVTTMTMMMLMIDNHGDDEEDDHDHDLDPGWDRWQLWNNTGASFAFR